MKKIVLILIMGIFIVSGTVASGIPSMSSNDNQISQSTISMDSDCEYNAHDEMSDNDEECLFVNYPVMTNPIYVDSLKLYINTSKLTMVDTPEYFSWKDYEGGDFTTSARNQGNCGSCWDFAAIGTFESIINIREGCAELDPDLSEQYALSCLPYAANTPGEGCRGGNPYWTFLYHDGNNT